MKKIIVATDFSDVARVAVHYAADMAVDYKATLVILHVVHIDGPPRAMLKTGSIEEAMIKAADVECQALEKDIQDRTGGAVTVKSVVVKGFPVPEVLLRQAAAEDADFIVVGTHGSTGLGRVFLGSIAASVINDARRPVIAVPEKAGYRGINRILYGTDLTDLEDEVETLARFTRVFNSVVDALYVSVPGESLTDAQRSLLDRFNKAHPHPEVHFHQVSDTSVIDGIDHFAAAQHSDLVALFTHHQGFFEHLFGHSVAQRMAFHARVPLLTFRKEPPDEA